MLKKEIQILASVFLVLLLILSGCSSNSNSNKKNGEVVLKLWTREGTGELIKSIVKKYNSQHKGVKVEVTTFPSNTFPDKLAAAISSGDTPDIVSSDLVLVPYFTSVGAFKDITDRYNALKVKNQFNESMVHLGQRDGKQYAIPFRADVSALIYNKAHFKEVGLDPDNPPKTWDELRSAAKKLTTKDHYGYVYSGADASGLMFTFMPYAWGNGGRVLNEDGSTAILDSPETKEAVEFFKTMTLDDKVTPPGVATYGWTQAQDAFTSGRVSMIVSGNFLVSVLNKDFPNLDYGVTLIPKNEGKSHSSFSGGDLIGIMSSSKHEDEAWDFIKYTLTKNVQVDTFAKDGVIPVIKDFYDNKYFNEEPKYRVFADALNVARAPYTTKYNELYDPLVNGLQKAFMGKESVDDAVKEINDNLNKVLKK